MAITLHILKEQNKNKTHKVSAGDTMWDISKKYKVDIEQLKAANPLIKNINLIYPGDIINIPSSNDFGMPAGKQKQKQRPEDIDFSLDPVKIVVGEDKEFRDEVDELSGHILASKALSQFQVIKKVEDPSAKIVPIGAQRYPKAVDKAVSMAKRLRQQVDQDLVSDEDKKYFFELVAKTSALTSEGIYPKFSTSGSAIEIYLSLKPNTMITGIPWSSRHSRTQGKVSREEFVKMYENLLLVKDLYQNGSLGNFSSQNFYPKPPDNNFRDPMLAPSGPLPRAD